MDFEEILPARDILKKAPPLEGLDAEALLAAARKPFVLGAYDFFFLLALAEKYRREFARKFPGREYPGYRGACSIPAIWIGGGYDLRALAEKGIAGTPLPGRRGETVLACVLAVVRKELAHEIGLVEGKRSAVDLVLEAVDLIGDLSKVGPSFDEAALKATATWKNMAKKFLGLCEQFFRKPEPKSPREPPTAQALQEAEKRSREILRIVDFRSPAHPFRESTLFAPFLEARPLTETDLDRIRAALDREGDPFFHLRYGRLDHGGLFG